MTDIYKQHDTAFQNVNAYVICKDRERVATIAFKRGQSITCYLHVIGTPMTKGIANGGGYDRHSAAAYGAGLNLKVLDGAWSHMNNLIKDIQKALEEGNGPSSWERALTKAGFSVFQAV